MTKISIKILMLICFCFDLNAMSSVYLNISQSSVTSNHLKIEVKNGSTNHINGEVTIYLKSDDNSPWYALKKEDGSEYKQELGINPDGRDFLLVDLLRNAQQVKVKFKMLDESGKESVLSEEVKFKMLDESGKENILPYIHRHVSQSS